ncbi:helix-turn-helix domain-containing protein [Wenjunlia tyrosinilytica]|uniref:Transcriptional regulator n=1 Tax=Wenjunlia tyrosinilytica TaxID=1544741 RepID=A0A917ZTE3_9ACTN|nr:helix-turn-helix transcriptional regulator [Wenjunlia tyrosinilytica]GGO93002.1 transcriptional regulator [Wenjunlia tyrosinilytica]
MARTRKKSTAATATQYFAHLLRMLRTQEGLSQEQLGKRMGYTGALVSAVETCARFPTEEFIARADDALKVGGLLLAATEYLADDRYPQFFQEFALLEAQALSVSSYSTLVLNGLVQTEAYARTLIEAHFPPLDEEEVDRLVTARMERKALLTRKPTAVVNFVIEESVLRWPVGGKEVMREQLAHLASCAELRNVNVHVMPQSRGAHAGVDGPMTLLETPEHTHLAYLESQGNSLLLNDADEVGRMMQRYAMIRSQALRLDESAALIKQLAGEL